MADGELDGPGLSPASLEILASALAARSPAAPPEPVEVERLLVRHLTLGSSPDEMKAVARLTAEPRGVALLSSALDYLDGLSRLPWRAAAGQAASSAFEAGLRSEWFAVLAAVAAAEAAPEPAPTWEAVRRQAQAGFEVARAAVARLRSFGGALTDWMARPQFAAARAEAGPEFIGSWPEGVASAIVEARIDPDGSLHARMDCRDPWGGACAAASGTPVTLDLVAGDARWTAGSATVSGDRAEWRVADIGADLGLPVGDVPAACLRLRIGEAAAPAGDTAWRVPVRSAERGRPAAELEIGPAGWRAGVFTARAALTGASADAFAGHSLVLALAVGRDWAQRIDAWPVSTLSGRPAVLSAPCPGMPDMRLAGPGSVRAWLEVPSTS